MGFGNFIHFSVLVYAFEDCLVTAPKLGELEINFLEAFHKFLQKLDCFVCRGEGIQLVDHIKRREFSLSLFRKFVVVVATCTLKRAGRRTFDAINMAHVLVDYHIWSGILPPQEAKRRLIIRQNTNLKHALNIRGYSDRHVFTDANNWLQQVLY